MNFKKENEYLKYCYTRTDEVAALSMVNIGLDLIWLVFKRELPGLRIQAPNLYVPTSISCFLPLYTIQTSDNAT